MLALALAALVSSAALPPGYKLAAGNVDDQIDATCALASSIGVDKEKGVERELYSATFSFYVGRLSARASNPDWRVTFQKEADNAVDESNYTPVAKKCSARMMSILEPDKPHKVDATP